jgi:hypothetical protein
LDRNKLGDAVCDRRQHLGRANAAASTQLRPARRGAAIDFKPD